MKLWQVKKERNPGPRSIYLPHELRQLEGKNDVQADAGGENRWASNAEDQNVDLTIIHASWPIRVDFDRRAFEEINANVEWLPVSFTVFHGISPFLLIFRSRASQPPRGRQG